MKIIAMAAHPDDTELLCAGTLALLSELGHEVSVCHMTVGDKGGTADPNELARTRAAEAAASCGLIGARYITGFCGDLELYDNEPHLAHIRSVLEDVDPDVVLTHAPNDYHPDHRITGKLTVRATADLWPARPDDYPEVWYMDNLGGVDFVPGLYVDIETTYEVKREMLRCHESQIAWMTQVRHTDMEYVIEWISRWRGLQAGCVRAEGFRVRAGDGHALTEAAGSAAVQTSLTTGGESAWP